MFSVFPLLGDHGKKKHAQNKTLKVCAEQNIKGFSINLYNLYNLFNLYAWRVARNTVYNLFNLYKWKVA